jgi:phosphopantothenoylcysteine decarboxylase / phosphopantothenate---cysteine ligase
MGGLENEIALVTRTGIDRWPRMGKDEVARRLALKIAEALPGLDGDMKLAAE